MGLDLTPLSLTRKLLSFNTINPPGNERVCATYIGQLLEETGLEVKTYEFDRNRTTVVARVRGDGSNPPICFSGHLDTVPLGTAAWSKDPFVGEVHGDRVYGRGAADMKAGVAAMVLMARRVARMPGLVSGMTLVLTAGEETGCAGAHHVAQLDNVLGEAGAIVVGEPTSNYPIVGHKGCVRFEITTRGTTAHAAMPEQGDNAILKAVQVITRLQEFDFGVSPHPLLGAPTLNVGTISGGINVNSVPDRTTIGVDIRTLPSQDHDDIQRAIQAALGEDVEIRPTRSARSIATDSKHRWIQEVFNVMEAVLQERPEAAAVGYFTDASVLKAAYGDPPTLILGPGEPTMAHRTDEFCAISKIEEATEVYVEIAKRWCSR